MYNLYGEPLIIESRDRKTSRFPAGQHACILTTQTDRVFFKTSVDLVVLCAPCLFYGRGGDIAEKPPNYC